MAIFVMKIGSRDDRENYDAKKMKKTVKRKNRATILNLHPCLVNCIVWLLPLCSVMPMQAVIGYWEQFYERMD